MSGFFMLGKQPRVLWPAKDVSLHSGSLKEELEWHILQRFLEDNWKCKEEEKPTGRNIWYCCLLWINRYPNVHISKSRAKLELSLWNSLWELWWRHLNMLKFYMHFMRTKGHDALAKQVESPIQVKEGWTANAKPARLTWCYRANLCNNSKGNETWFDWKKISLVVCVHAYLAFVAAVSFYLEGLNT